MAWSRLSHICIWSNVWSIFFLSNEQDIAQFVSRVIASYTSLLRSLEHRLLVVFHLNWSINMFGILCFLCSFFLSPSFVCVNDFILYQPERKEPTKKRWESIKLPKLTILICIFISRFTSRWDVMIGGLFFFCTLYLFCFLYIHVKRLLLIVLFIVCTDNVVEERYVQCY